MALAPDLSPHVHERDSRLPNVPYRDRPHGDPFLVFSDSSRLHGHGFARMTPLTKRLRSHLQGTEAQNPQSQNGKGNKKLGHNKPRLLLMGQRRSGKSSITSVVFHKMPPQETLFLESTTRIQKDSMHSFMDFQIWDFPGQLDYFDPTNPTPDFDPAALFSTLGALVWVIDAQDDYTPSLLRLVHTILHLQSTHPHIHIEVLIHKTDGLNQDWRTEILQDVSQRIEDELSDAGYGSGDDRGPPMPQISYYMTSIYDYTIFEAFSKIIQRLVPQLPTLENLLNILVNNTGMEKAYLFDVLSKIYIGSDTRPSGSSALYEMGSDFVDVVVDTSELYSYIRDLDQEGRKTGPQCIEAESQCIVQDGTMIYLLEMNKYLCLVALIKNPEAKDRKGLIDYNCHVFQDALNDVFDRSWEKKAEQEEEGEGAGDAAEDGDGDGTSA